MYVHFTVNMTDSVANHFDDYGQHDDTGRLHLQMWAAFIYMRSLVFGKQVPLEEQRYFRPGWLEKKYGDVRMIFNDTTDVRLKGRPSLAWTQALTYRKYYHDNVCKGGVSISCFGFVACWRLMSTVSDSCYMPTSGILKEQEEFADKDRDAGGNLVVCNSITDKGTYFDTLMYTSLCVFRSVCMQRADL
jgi:hypothetical protein